MDNWDTDIENLLERIRQNAIYRSEYHRKNFYYYIKATKNTFKYH